MTPCFSEMMHTELLGLPRGGMRALRFARNRIVAMNKVWKLAMRIFDTSKHVRIDGPPFSVQIGEKASQADASNGPAGFVDEDGLEV